MMFLVKQHNSEVGIVDESSSSSTGNVLKRPRLGDNDDEDVIEDLDCDMLHRNQPVLMLSLIHISEPTRPY